MNTEELRKLVEKWRVEAEDEYQSGLACDCEEPGYKALRRCANELAALLDKAAAPGPTPQVTPEIENAAPAEPRDLKGKLFNLITRHAGDELIFSRRMRITEAVLKACEDHMEGMEKFKFGETGGRVYVEWDELISILGSQAEGRP